MNCPRCGSSKVHLRPYRESDPLFANAPYELSKACADMTVRMYQSMNYLKNAVVVRPSNQYGPADLNPRIIPNTIRRCLKGQRPIIFDGVTYTREFTYVEDTVEALLLLSQRLPDITGQAFNIGTGVQKDQNEVVTQILKCFPGLQSELRPPKAYTRKEIPYQILDSSKIRNLGWKPNTDFATGVLKTVYWWRKHPELW